MRIAILSCFYPYRGGIAQFNAELCRELGKTDTVRAFNFTRQYPELLFPGKTQYVTEDDQAVKIESFRVLDLANPFTWCKTASVIRDFNPDLLLMRYWMPYFAPSLGYVARHVRQGGKQGREGKVGQCCKVVSILDNVVPHEAHFADKALTRYFLYSCDGFVTMCDAVSRDLVSLRSDARYIMRPHPLYSHFGAKLPRNEAEARLGLLSGKRNILFFGLIRQYKGLDILLNAFSGLGEEYQLIIAGEPYGSFEPYSKLIEAMPEAAGRIHVFPGFVKDDDVKLYFSAADVTVLPYRSATQSGISSVSYHFEVPMIVTDVGGLRQAIGDTGTGLVASEVSPEAISEEIRRFFSDPLLRESCVTNIRKEKSRLSWSRFCDDLRAFAKTI